MTIKSGLCDACQDIELTALSARYIRLTLLVVGGSRHVERGSDVIYQQFVAKTCHLHTMCCCLKMRTSPFTITYTWPAKPHVELGRSSPTVACWSTHCAQ